MARFRKAARMVKLIKTVQEKIPSKAVQMRPHWFVGVAHLLTSVVFLSCFIVAFIVGAHMTAEMDMKCALTFLCAVSTEVFVLQPCRILCASVVRMTTEARTIRAIKPKGKKPQV